VGKKMPNNFALLKHNTPPSFLGQPVNNDVKQISRTEEQLILRKLDIFIENNLITVRMVNVH